MRIAYFVKHFSLRGTEVAIYDYARYAQELLGHEPLIVAIDGNPISDPEVQRKFADRFDIELVSSFTEADKAAARRQADLFYFMKSAHRDTSVSQHMPTAVHAVFGTSMRYVHGDSYAFVSSWLSRHSSGGTLPYVPHVVTLPQPNANLRVGLGIPADATVFGCYGGADSFDIPGAQRAVARLLDRRKDAYFIAMNIHPFVQHERAVFLPGSADLQSKSNFISACDAMVHARRRGESFGIACGEFSLMNKPVITYDGSFERSHLEILGDKALRYRSEAELDRLLAEFDREDACDRNWDAYSTAFSPAAVLNQFHRVFVEGSVAPSPYTAAARAIVVGERLSKHWRRELEKHRSLMKSQPA